MTGDERGPGAGIELRALTSDDWATWRLIRLEALAGAPYAFGSRYEDWAQAPEERWRARLQLPGSHNLVAYLDGAPVAMATGVAGEDAVGLISMYVAPAVRGRGVGGVLLDALEEWACDRGATAFCLDVRASNAAARRLYERHGFVVTGEADRKSPEDPLELRMCKPLSR